MKTNRIALITGASSGLGMSFARRFAQLGYDLVITGRNKERLVQLSSELESRYSIAVCYIIAELSDEEDVRKITKAISGNKNISVLVNNAGYGSGQEFSSFDIETHMKMLRVHVIASLNLIHAVLPQMISRHEGTIINISSLGAFMPAPGSTMYSSTKLFLKSFSESLHMEVSNFGIKVHCLCPGFTQTEFHKRRAAGKIGKTGGILWMSADDVVEECMEAIGHGRVVHIPGLVNRILFHIVKMIPTKIYYRLMVRTARGKTTGKPVLATGSVDVQPAF